ncbi:hypothetical protein ACFFX0_08195 [Citricoccus parietis]|uniref:Uncharacterized protein n=1 Tax=Citricoccus parietis TaxID=592307 RepID=A0ABV5FWX4_9MICC
MVPSIGSSLPAGLGWRPCHPSNPPAVTRRARARTRPRNSRNRPPTVTPAPRISTAPGSSRGSCGRR